MTEPAARQEPHERIPQKFSPQQMDHVTERMEPYSSMEPDAEMSSEQPSPTPTNPCSTKYDLRHNPRTKCNDIYRN